MESNELRIGNLVHYKLFPNIEESFIEVEITAIAKTHVTFFHEDEEQTVSILDIIPIELTRENLLKFRMEAVDYEKMYLYDDVFFIESINSKWVLCHHSGDSIIDLKYVHLLQNIVYDLTGNELMNREN